MRKLYRCYKRMFLVIKYLPLLLLLLLSFRQFITIKKYIIDDIYVWEHLQEIKTKRNVIFDLLQIFEERHFFRNLFYFRIKNLSILRLLRYIYKEERLFHISHDTKIGSSPMLSHPFGSFLNANSIGNNVHILHNVTIGFNGKDFRAPEIGNNVFVGCGAVIIGGISIGNDVNIGSNSVITKNVPSNCTVVGNPAIIVRLNGEKTNITL